ncbi:MAG TPA: hypothetical protein VLV81_05600 [Acidimicrobiia bacterium]|nr:hypothetical protein [Acidimicrobiia bacterium]
MDHPVTGTVLPVLEMKVDAGQGVVTGSGKLSWTTSSIEGAARWSSALIDA